MEAAVVATDVKNGALRLLKRLFLLLLTSTPLFAAVLPEERADVLYHRYDGGGLTVDGPSVLVRKNVADTVSISGNYYVDKISSASIDVVSQASPNGYSETRTEKSLSATYLYDRTLMSASVIDSDEPDYTARTYSFDFSQDFFGDLTTFNMGYTRGSDTIKKNGTADFEEDATRQEYRIGLTQILTRNLLVGISEEIITDQGYLNSPYRQVRYLDPSGSGYLFQPEIYPSSRTSNTTSLRARYHLPNHRSAVYGNYRHYSDGWDIKGNTFELGYTYTLPQGWLFDVHYRYYKQSQADFYSDLFPYQDAQNYLARDRQLSDFHSSTFGAGISYEMPLRNNKWVDKASVNLYWDRMQVDYENFTDITIKDVAPGNEPLYSFDADIVRFFLTVWY
jgi:hypothetical protein